MVSEGARRAIERNVHTKKAGGLGVVRCPVGLAQSPGEGPGGEANSLLGFSVFFGQNMHSDM